ncbi:SLBB domain-containing protein [Gammaproteobacteria bacterium]|nr:SLBB domain-containing protein [Gammaproteobacteria bacterium]
MKKTFIALLLLTQGVLQSQEIDEAYLKSLPDSVRQDVIERISKKEGLEEPTYRRPSSSIEKPDNEKGDEDVKIERFGQNFFDTVQSSFMPINEPNLSSSYILDFGDVLEIQLIGQKDSIDSYPIARDGSINIPGIGKIILSGLSISDASALIKNKVQNAYIGAQSFITLKNIRDISILIAGNAFSPGIYTLNGNSNMLHALHIAGGIDNIGSYRDISLIRNGEVIDSLDVYEVLIDGKHNLNKGLRSGDSIVVNPLINMVSIESGVLRPGNYELKDGESVMDIIKYANGLNKEADIETITLKRLSGIKIVSIDLNKDELNSIKLQDGDSIYITENKINKVTIEGAVRNPGKYLVPTGTKLSELITIAGGYDSAAYPFAGYLENKKALEINKLSKEKLYDAFINSLISNISSVNGSGDDKNIGLITEQIKNAETTGRIIAEFNLDVIKSNPNLDTSLEDGDKIIIPNMTQQVYIQGEVSNPGAVRYVPGQSIEFYLNNAGGALNNADIDNLFIVHPNGETQNLTPKSSLSFIMADNTKQLIYPGSIIYIPQSTDLTNSIQVASIWAPIISSIALSITSLSVLNNN